MPACPAEWRCHLWPRLLQSERPRSYRCSHIWTSRLQAFPCPKGLVCGRKDVTQVSSAKFKNMRMLQLPYNLALVLSFAILNALVQTAPISDAHSCTNICQQRYLQLQLRGSTLPPLLISLPPFKIAPKERPKSWPLGSQITRELGSFRQRIWNDTWKICWNDGV